MRRSGLPLGDPRAACRFLYDLTRVDETRFRLGVRHDFTTASGARIGKITYRNGRRELLVFDESDPDECRASVQLSEEDAHALADLRGASQIVEHLERLDQD